MIKRILSALLAVCLVLSLSGCGSIFNGRRYVVSDYIDESSADDDIDDIKSYNSLYRAVNGMVVRHDEEGHFKFLNYSGDISDDLAQACREVKSETALGAYSIDYISYDVSRIVSYYEASVYITYKRSKDQADSIVSIGSSINIKKYLQDCMTTMNPSLTLSMNTTMVDEASVREYISDIYYSNPLCCVICPDVTVNIYPDTGVQKIFEIYFNYSGIEKGELSEMKADLLSTAANYANEVDDKSPQSSVVSIISLMRDRCICSDLTPLDEDYDPLSSTAYGAVVGGFADSEGFAVGVASLCVASGVKCTVVSGRLNNEEHYWNIVEFGGSSYHIDAFELARDPSLPIRFLSDTDISGSYWWDTSKYPACTSSLYAAPVSAAETEGIIEN